MNRYIAISVGILAVAVTSGYSKPVEQAQVAPATSEAVRSSIPAGHQGDISEAEKRERLKKMMGTEPAPWAKRTKNYLE
ncbi:hypothetical protein [Massilia eurypsychrophila]|nr:hypothetical protein [Massilia eurypsychrophila]